MSKGICFEEWVINRAEEEIGVQALVSHKILRAKFEIRIKMATLLSNAIARSLSDEGRRLTGKGELFFENDAELRAQAIGVVINTLNGELPIEYVNFVFTHWKKEYQTRIDLQNRSLWGILKWVIRRSWLKWHNNYNPEAFYGG